MTNTDRTHPFLEAGTASHAETEGARTSAAALTSGLVSLRQPDGLILSTGNLYFTSHEHVGGSTNAYVWRTAQSAVPGQEAQLYKENVALFGDIVFAQVGGAFFGYFFATPRIGEPVVIKRVPLTGGPATIVPAGPAVHIGFIDIFNTHRNLVTDGAYLYWQNHSSVQKIPIGGGDITVLDDAPTSTPTAGLALQGKNLIYASENHIRFVPTDGSTILPPHLRTIVTAATRVTALHAVDNGAYWGEESGAVKVKVGTTVTTLPSTPGLVPTSISTNGRTAGAAQAWSQCGGSSGCKLHFAYPSWNSSSAIGTRALGVTVTSASNVFWGDDAGVHRQVFFS
jgi:hypothetical protein